MTSRFDSAVAVADWAELTIHDFETGLYVQRMNVTSLAHAHAKQFVNVLDCRNVNADWWISSQLFFANVLATQQKLWLL